MNTLGDILQQRMKDHEKFGKEWFLHRSKEYNKSWAKGVKFFQNKINEDRKKEGGKSITFMAVRQKLLALREVDDLRWFYYHLIKYAGTKDKDGVKNTFSKGFFGALKVDRN